MSKKVIYILIIIALIIAGIFVATRMTKKDKTKPVLANTLEQTNKTNEENVVEEDFVGENNTIEQEKNEVVNDVQNTEVESENTEIEPGEKAKQIVKENWGEDDSVYYSYDGIDEQGRYVICVRETATTKELYRYYVDVETGTFDIE